MCELMFDKKKNSDNLQLYMIHYCGSQSDQKEYY